jgi:hypothetical protein
MNTPISKHDLKYTKTLIVSSKDDVASLDNEFLFEETETENENDLQAQSFILPFFVTYFQYESFQSKLFSTQPLAEKLSNPIYISVCNFRI